MVISWARCTITSRMQALRIVSRLPILMLWRNINLCIKWRGSGARNMPPTSCLAQAQSATQIAYKEFESSLPWTTWQSFLKSNLLSHPLLLILRILRLEVILQFMIPIKPRKRLKSICKDSTKTQEAGLMVTLKIQEAWELDLISLVTVKKL